eukprot:882444_1
MRHFTIYNILCLRYLFGFVNKLRIHASMIAAGLLGYTVHKQKLKFLVWTHSREAIECLESASYWSEYVCRHDEDSALDNVREYLAQDFSERTGGLFVKDGDNRVTSSAKMIRSRLENKDISLALSRGSPDISEYRCYVIPLRFAKSSKLNAHIKDTPRSASLTSAARAEWVDGMELLARLRASEIGSTVAVRRAECETDELELLLPFTSMLREHLSELSKLPQMLSNLEDVKIEIEKPKEDTLLEPEVKESKSAPNEPKPPKVAYTCAKCRIALFSDRSVRSHEPKEDHSQFYRKKWNDGTTPTTSDCHSYFIDQVESLADFSTNAGKLSCPKCRFKIGHFDHSGTQCSCGAWVVPAIQVIKSKVDSISLEKQGSSIKRVWQVTKPQIKISK